MADQPSTEPHIAVTSNEVAERKHLAQPYGKNPVVDENPPPGVCRFCGNFGFRRSRLRFADLSRLLTLKLPVRCVRCGKRQYAGLSVASLAHAPRPEKRTSSRDTGDSWKNWTEQTSQKDAARRSGAFKEAAHTNRRSEPPDPGVRPPAARSTPPSSTPSRRKDDGGIW